MTNHESESPRILTAPDIMLSGWKEGRKTDQEKLKEAMSQARMRIVEIIGFIRYLLRSDEHNLDIMLRLMATADFDRELAESLAGGIAKDPNGNGFKVFEAIEEALRKAGFNAHKNLPFLREIITDKKHDLGQL